MGRPAARARPCGPIAPSRCQDASRVGTQAGGAPSELPGGREGEGLLASVDELLLRVPVRTVNAAPPPEHFGFTRGKWSCPVPRVTPRTSCSQVRAYDPPRMPGREGRPTPLGASFAVCGRIAKTEHIDAAVAQLRADGHEIREKDIARLSPLKHRNLDLPGRYGFTAQVPAPRPASAARSGRAGAGRGR